MPNNRALVRQVERQIDRLLDATRGKRLNPMNSLLEPLADQLAAYEVREVPMPRGKPADVLRLLMESNGLTQSDLGSELGGQSVVSAVLSGKRPINARQARALSTRFRVSPAVFIA